MVNNSMRHRAIYEQHHGPIPKDEQGRSMEIHHIDGNHNNNDISNLKLVTIDEHYKIHFDQGDYGACVIMSYRMKLDFNQISELSRKCQQKLVAEGKHHWQRRPDGTSASSDRVKNGTHPFLGSDVARERNLKRVRAGTHNLLKKPDGSSQAGDRVKAGTHHFVTNNPSTVQSQNGTHHFLTNHPNKIKVECPHCGKVGGSTNMRRYHFENCKHKNNAG